jgi:hypothetical protein
MERNILDSYSESEIEEAFVAVFDEMAKYNYINSYDIVADRDYDDAQRMKITVNIGSMAGAPTRDQFPATDGMESFELTFVTGAKATVTLDEVVDVNTMEYRAIYVESEPVEKDGSGEVQEEKIPEINLSGSSEIE